MKQAVNLEKGAGRPACSRTRFKGITAFAKQHGYGVVYVHEVLAGKRSGGRPVRLAWARWKAAQVAAK